MDLVRFPERDLPVALSADVLVVGGGPAGIAAAVASGRSGVRTALVERHGFLGGTGTAGLVTIFMPWERSGRAVVGGLFAETRDRMSHHLGGIDGPLFDPEALIVTALDMLEEASVELLLYSPAVDVVRAGASIEAVALASKGGPRAAVGNVVIDCTGDADIAARAGCATVKGRPEDGLTQPLTACFHVGGVDLAAMPAGDEMTAAYRAARERGEVDCPREDVLFMRTVHPGGLLFNTTRVTHIDGSDAVGLTRAEIAARRQAEAVFGVLKREFAAFRNAFIVRVAAQVGVRETRHIVGEYTLTGDDAVECRRFHDSIACCCYPIDIHNPDGEGTVLRSLQGDYYGIPYRCLLPRGVDNLLVAGRPISADHVAHSSLRIMPTCFALGEAAGVAAALAAKDGALPRQVQPGRLRAELVSRGAFVGEEPAEEATA